MHLTDYSPALLKGDIRLFERLFSDFVRDTLSYFDTVKNNVEAVYQAFLLGMLVNISSDYEIESNRESGYGRYDIAIIPKDVTRPRYHYGTKKKWMIFMKKRRIKRLLLLWNSWKKWNMRRACVNGGVTDILVLAVTFDGKRVWVREG